MNVLERRKKKITTTSNEADRILSGDIKDISEMWNTVLRICKSCDDEMSLLLREFKNKTNIQAHYIEMRVLLLLHARQCAILHYARMV